MILQTVYFFYIPILFECDAASYFRSASAILEIFSGDNIAGYNYDRGPFYSVFLILSGGIFPGTLKIILLVQFFLGVFSGVLFYRINCLFCSQRIAFLSAIILLFSGITLYGAKQILPYQFFIFSLLVCLYYFLKFLKNNEKIDLYFFYFFICIAIFIRWDLQLLFLLATIFLLIKNLKKKLFFNVLLSSGFVFGLMFFYTFLKFLATGNEDHLGKIHMHTGSQLFWSVYVSAYEMPIEKVNTSLVYLQNGRNTKIIYDVLLKKLKNNEEIVESERSWLSGEKYSSNRVNTVAESYSSKEQTYKNQNNAYYQLYEKFKGNPKGLVDSMFHSDGYLSNNIHINGFYIPFIIRNLKKELGESKAQDLLLKASIEAIWNHKKLYFNRRLHTILSFTNYYHMGSGNWDFYSIKQEYSTIAQPFNLANCAGDVLSNQTMKEYEFDRKLYNNIPFVENFKKISSISRNLCRMFFGPVFFVLSIIFLFVRNKNSPILIFLIPYTWAHIFLLTLLAGGSHTKYEVIILILFILSFFYFISGFKKIQK